MHGELVGGFVSMIGYGPNKKTKRISVASLGVEG